MTNEQLYLESKALYLRLLHMVNYRAAALANRAYWRMCRRAHTAKWPNGELDDE